MNNYMRYTAVVILIVSELLVSACNGRPVRLAAGKDPDVKYSDKFDVISSEACGFQFFLFIPFKVNSRYYRAYKELQLRAQGGYIVDIQERESWLYGLIGTGYCTELRAKVYRKKLFQSEK